MKNTMGRLFIEGNIFIEIPNLLRETIGKISGIKLVKIPFELLKILEC